MAGFLNLARSLRVQITSPLLWMGSLDEIVVVLTVAAGALLLLLLLLLLLTCVGAAGWPGPEHVRQTMSVRKVSIAACRVEHHCANARPHRMRQRTGADV